MVRPRDQTEPGPPFPPSSHPSPPSPGSLSLGGLQLACHATGGGNTDRHCYHITVTTIPREADGHLSMLGSRSPRSLTNPGMEHAGDDDTALQLRHLSLSAAAAVTDNSPCPRAAAGAQLDPLGGEGEEASPADGRGASSCRHASSLVLVRSRPTPPPSYPAAGCCCGGTSASLDHLPNEVLLHILGFLDVCDLLSTSRVRNLLFFSPSSRLTFF